MSQKVDNLVDFLTSFDKDAELAKVFSPIDNLQKIKIKHGAKEPFESGWRTDPKTYYKNIDMTRYNAGFLCGEVNNIMVLDVDVKDDGVGAMVEYFREFGKFNTFTVRTRSGGYHYYFNYKSKDNNDNYLKNGTKFRGVGLDFKTEGGYVLTPGSCVDGKYYKVINQTKIIDMPNDLLTWLLAFKADTTKTQKEKKEKKVIPNVDDHQYDITDEQFVNILNQLDQTYLNNYSDWLRVTTVCKHHDKFDIWDEWSKKSDNYDKNKNMAIWNSNKGAIDINYLCYILKIDKIKKYKKISYDISTNNNIDYIEYNNKYVYDVSFNDVQYDYDIFEKYDTVIVKACCGTGKTTGVSQHVKKYMDANPGTKFLSIVDRETLADQHAKSFSSLNIEHYKTTKIEPCDASALVLCINSLTKLSKLTKEDKNKYIVFIDEITSFLNITHNSTLDKNIKVVYNMLISIIRHAHKVIVGDAIILDNVFEILKSRIKTEDKKTLFITNNYNKFQGVPAVRVRNERLMLNKLIQQCKEGKPFLFGCDAASLATKWYNRCKTEVSEEEHDKFILLTADTNITITDAEKQFKNKYVFYSPKITYGVDFSIDTPQNVYIYQKGDTIMPNGTFQQTTRCRNIQTLYYYSECKEKDASYKDLEDVKETLRKNIQYFQDKNRHLYNVSTIYDEDDEEYKVVENSFFNLFCFSEYMIDLYKTNMTKHYQDLLIMNGFVMSEEGTIEKLDKEEKQALSELTKEIQEELFKEYLETEHKGHEKYDSFNRHIDFLQIPKDNETLEKYKNEIMDKYVLQDHLNIIRLLKTDDYIKGKLIAAKESSYDIKNMTMIYSKVKAIRDLEKKYKIQPLEVDYTMFGDINMDDNEYRYIRNVFRITRDKPKTYNELRSIYISMIRNITTGDLITGKQSMKKETRKQMLYSIDEKTIQHHLELNKFYNTDCTHFDDSFVTKYNIPVKKVKFDNSDDEYDIDENCRLLDVII
jgi:hypothetical protein